MLDHIVALQDKIRALEDQLRNRQLEENNKLEGYRSAIQAHEHLQKNLEKEIRCKNRQISALETQLHGKKKRRNPLI